MAPQPIQDNIPKPSPERSGLPVVLKPGNLLKHHGHHVLPQIVHIICGDRALRQHPIDPWGVDEHKPLPGICVSFLPDSLQQTNGSVLHYVEKPGLIEKPFGT